MSIEIRNLSITSSVVQRQGAETEQEDTGEGDGDGEQLQPLGDWRAECRRMILEALDARRER